MGRDRFGIFGIVVMAYGIVHRGPLAALPLWRIAGAVRWGRVTAGDRADREHRWYRRGARCSIEVELPGIAGAVGTYLPPACWQTLYGPHRGVSGTSVAIDSTDSTDSTPYTRSDPLPMTGGRYRWSR